jgi:hypothetical protein
MSSASDPNCSPPAGTTRISTATCGKNPGNRLWSGEIWNRRIDGSVYPEHLDICAVRGDNGEVLHYVGTFLDLTERKAAEDRIRQLAEFDILTRLPNRSLFSDRLAQAIGSGGAGEQAGGGVRDRPRPLQER